MMSALIPDVVLHLLLHLAGAGQAVEDGEPEREVEQLGERGDMGGAEVHLGRNVAGLLPVALEPVGSHPPFQLIQRP
jgi:hypothetical protein